MNAMGAQAFAEVSSQTPVDQNTTVNAYVQCVVKPLTEAARGKTDVTQWDIKVFNSKEINAFALPGGKIGVYTGILPVAKTPSELATVVGHEIGHVIAKHGGERMSEQLVEAGGLEVVQAFLSGTASPAQNQMIMAALGVGTQVGIQLPHSRTQEAEADEIGLKLMAEAGFDPRQSITLWQNMTQATQGQQSPEWLSDHPANENRIKDLQAHMPEAIKLEEQARAQGKNPQCTPP